MMAKRICILLGFLFWVSLLASQADTIAKWRIITLDDNEYIGEIVKSTADTVVIKTEILGVVRIPSAQIKSSVLLQAQTDNLGVVKYWPENHHATRYFFGPNSYGLTKGEGYYQNNWILFNQVSYAFTDHITIGLGIFPTFLFGESSFPIWITPKFSFPKLTDEFRLGAGALAGTIVGEDISFGIGYGTATYGSKDKNVTLGVGYGYSNGEFSKTPTISLSAMIRASKKFYFITENYWLGVEDFGLLSFGGRTAWPNLALEYGGVIPIGIEENLVLIPWLGISVPFGRKNELQPQN